MIKWVTPRWSVVVVDLRYFSTTSGQKRYITLRDRSVPGPFVRRWLSKSSDFLSLAQDVCTSRVGPYAVNCLVEMHGLAVRRKDLKV